MEGQATSQRISKQEQRKALISERPSVGLALLAARTHSHLTRTLLSTPRSFPLKGFSPHTPHEPPHDSTFPPTHHPVVTSSSNAFQYPLDPLDPRTRRRRRSPLGPPPPRRVHLGPSPRSPRGIRLGSEIVPLGLLFAHQLYLSFDFGRNRRGRNRSPLDDVRLPPRSHLFPPSARSRAPHLPFLLPYRYQPTLVASLPVDAQQLACVPHATFNLGQSGREDH